MGNFNKEIYMRGCHLVTKFCGDTSDMYQFVFNPDTAEFSDIYACGTGLEFEIEEDGAYTVITLYNEDAELIDGKLKLGNGNIYSAEEIASIVGDEHVYNGLDVGVYDIDETFSICKLKKCLANLEMKMFQEMLKNCGQIKCKSNESRSQIDFLFTGIWLIEHYIELGNIERARAIYDRLKGCGNLCENLLKDKRSCGCDG